MKKNEWKKFQSKKKKRVTKKAILKMREKKKVREKKKMREKKRMREKYQEIWIYNHCRHSSLHKGQCLILKANAVLPYLEDLGYTKIRRLGRRRKMVSEERERD